jgi:hypothetical protein
VSETWLNIVDDDMNLELRAFFGPTGPQLGSQGPLISEYSNVVSEK